MKRFFYSLLPLLFVLPFVWIGAIYAASERSPFSEAEGSGYSGGGGGCFIAACAYGSSLAKEGSILKEFRDRYLVTNRPGRFFVYPYYAIGPPVAHFIGRHGSLRAFARVILSPAVGLSYWFLKSPLEAGLLSVGTFVLFGLVLIKRKKAGAIG